MTSGVAVDTSVAVPLLLAPHPAHASVVRWWDGRDLVLSGHALVETYSVLTRLPAGLRLDATTAATLLQTRFGPPLVLDPATSADLPGVLAGLGIGGGAAYDALVALAAKQAGAPLATRDGRARGTYELVGARTVQVG